MGNEEQIAMWNGAVGLNWVSHDALMETMLAPLGETVIEALAPAPGERALDVGCGCGHPTLSLARRLGSAGRVTGVDVSAPMLAVAKGLADAAPDDYAAIDFLEADAQSHGFAPGSFDLVFSRFGVMFFENPVTAFSNIRGAMAPEGRLGFCCWQPREVNPFMTVPAQAALELLPPPPAVAPRSPGPFAFEEQMYIEDILTAAGFKEITVHSVAHPIAFGKGLSLAAVVEHLVKIGPIAQMVRDAPEDLQQPVRNKVMSAISPYYAENSGLTMPGQFWQATAST